VEKTEQAQIYRELTADEKKLLLWLLENGNKVAKNYKAQVANAMVVGGCDCGCPTIDLAIGGKRERTLGPSTVLAEASGKSPDGVLVLVILHAMEGELSMLEIINMTDNENISFALPKPEDLEITNRD
jgi:hypothetical protein